MARGIRRRPKVVWLPVSTIQRAGQVEGDTTLGSTSSLGTFILDAPASFGGSISGVVPVVHDEGSPDAFAVASLADLESSAYRLRRIVGKIFVACQQAAEPSPTKGGSWAVTLGLIVLRTNPDGTPINTFDPSTYAPARIDSQADPWIWRRTWLLSDFVNALIPANGLGWAAPEGNWQCGSVADGPHIDQKTARVIGKEERLFLTAQALTVTGPRQSSQDTTQIQVYYDLRVLASMRTSMGNRRNASR